jgi:hypothetical protein
MDFILLPRHVEYPVHRRKPILPARFASEQCGRLNYAEINA